MKVKREIASIPVRSAGETWAAIVALISGADTPDAATLKAAASIMESLIADEHPATVPIVVKGNGDRLVIYCRYNEDAIELGSSIDKLTWNPTGGSGWKITAPIEAGDVTWMNDALKSRAPRLSVHDVASPPADEEEATKAAAADLAIDWGVLGKS
ncbi:hypothetical protein [Bradyrhizobium commune]|uniref:Uncharacterized protein n=1 Tax=Bradyrhizobium commune TaxID=83627 RepID=A0A7S9D448_9BRAD|nr:hypothetical protein [Bradyrhizobium commune]QPF90862.1 hypothetical protein IC761_31060 [Bradyrhizobium commune]